MKAQHVTLSPTEHEFYTSGVARGRAEGFDKIADQLQSAGNQYNSQMVALVEQGNPDWKQIAKFLAGQFAVLEAQIRPLVADSRKSAQRHLDAALKGRTGDQPTPSQMLTGSFDLSMECPNA